MLIEIDPDEQSLTLINQRKMAQVDQAINAVIFASCLKAFGFVFGDGN